MAEKNRVRIFVDFWNLQLNWNDHHTRAGATGRVQIPWKDILPTVLTTEASKGQPSKFAGAHVYASINPSSKKDGSLSNWMHHVLASFAGYSIEVKDRKPRKTIHCQEEACRAEVTSCPTCRSPLKGTVEKGIDAAIITDLISLAFDDTYDIAVLISGDADFALPLDTFRRRPTSKLYKRFSGHMATNCAQHVGITSSLRTLCQSL